MIQFDIFYKRYGVRAPTQLMVPPTPSIDKFEFPRNSLHHYVILDSVLEGPPSDEYFYRNIQKKIPIEHLVDLKGDKGPPKKLNIPIAPQARAFQMRNKRYRNIDNASVTVKDPMSLVVVNYGFLPRTVRYVRNMYTEYSKWWNIQKTLWTKVADVAANSDREQFVFCSLPTTLPSVSRLNTHAAKFSQQTLTVFQGPNSWFILELWKWLSEEFRFNSVIGEMPQESLDKITLVYQESGRFLMINLGLLNKWRYVKSGPPQPDQKIRIDTIDLQKRVLRMLLALMAERSVAVDQGVDPEQLNPGEVEDAELTTPVQTDDDSSGVRQLHLSGSDMETDEMTKAERSQEILSKMEDDLAQLEVLDRAIVGPVDEPDTEEEEEVVTAKIELKHNLRDFDTSASPEEKIKEICDDLADSGLITAAEYRRFLNLSASYKTIVSPDGKTTLDTYSTVTPEDLVVEPVEFTDIPTVLDKTMLKSTTLDMDAKYIKEVMQKDVASMVVNAQKGGFVITRYEVERIESILGAYDMHSVRVTPIEGQPSTIRFKLPVVDEDGVYLANGIRYKMRRQRREKSLAKTASDKVALSTYFGKTFVTRSDKKVYDRGQWLRDQIMAKAIDSSDQSITLLSPSNVFDNKFDAPKAYTSVAKGIRDFKSNGYTFMFDRNSIIFDKKISNKYNKGGSVVVAVNEAGEHLLMDKNNALYAITKEGLQPKGSFEQFLGIDTLNSPVDFSQVKIYGKNLPVALVLGYIYGLEPLMEMLKCTPRRVPTGQRVYLQDHEFSVQFADETLIFSRDDTMASMVFGGLKEYEKAIKNFSVHTFDKKDVYLNVLESQGIGPRYLREIQMFDDLFVDPISKGLLEADGLPTSFAGLLVKATEMLLTDTHPDALDMKQMRIAGYERMAGAVYAEICQAIRNHKSLSGRAHQPYDLSPHAVWRRIAEDPSITISSEINPIKNLKEKDAVTFSGTGGRTSRSMTRATREFHPNDLGVISEGTVDNSDVGINTFLSGNPNFVNLRGVTKPFDHNNPEPASVLSTASLLSVGADRDD